MKHKQKKGFTLIELMLSITFLSTLAVMIALLVSSAASTYRRGIVLKKINATGTEIMEDMRAAINNNHVGDLALVCDDVYSDPAVRDECKEDEGLSFVSIKATSPVVIKGANNYQVGETGDEAPIFGAFCTGQYSYLWNSGYTFNSQLYQISGIGAAKLIYKYTNDSGQVIEETATNFHLLKVKDEKRSICIMAIQKLSNSWGGSGYVSHDEIYGHLDSTFDIRSTPLPERPMELISGNNGEGLALYDLTVSKPAQGAANQITFYSGSFILGSIDGGVNIGSQNDYCKAYVDQGITDADYCAVNRFNFAVQTSGL